MQANLVTAGCTWRIKPPLRARLTQRMPKPGSKTARPLLIRFLASKISSIFDRNSTCPLWIPDLLVLTSNPPSSSIPMHTRTTISIKACQGLAGLDASEAPAGRLMPSTFLAALSHCVKCLRQIGLQIRHSLQPDREAHRCCLQAPVSASKSPTNQPAAQPMRKAVCARCDEPLADSA